MLEYIIIYSFKKIYYNLVITISDPIAEELKYILYFLK